MTTNCTARSSRARSRGYRHGRRPGRRHGAKGNGAGAGRWAGRCCASQGVAGRTAAPCLDQAWEWCRGAAGRAQDLAAAPRDGDRLLARKRKTARRRSDSRERAPASRP
ncbi:hypothetical protein HBB16_21165 [Pseudonocardia sp. MCCB 268]|nr:hypothetical protein [Pseudonocardia cytotoxica]